MNEVAEYVERVRAALADLPPAVRAELLEDLPEHLAEVAAEGEGSLADRLGPPETYAAELRAAAGAPVARPSAEVRIREAMRQASVRLRVVDARSGPLIGYEKTSDFLRLLRPAWWAARGYLVAMAIAYLLREEDIGLLPRLEVGDRTVAGLLMLLVFVVGSIWLGRRGSRMAWTPRVALGIGTALLMLPAVISLLEADEYAQRVPYEEVYYPLSGVEDIYVYDDQGRPLTNVRLVDQHGIPIDLGKHRACMSDKMPFLEVFPMCPAAEPFATPTPSETPTPTPSSTPTPTPSATG